MKPKFYLYLVVTIAMIILAVMGGHWSDLANTKFWWTFWDIAKWVSIALLLILWVIAYNGQNKKR